VDGFALQGGASLCNRFSSLLAQQAARLEAGIALCDGRLMDSTLSLADALPQRAESAAVQRIELLCPPACSTAQATGVCCVADSTGPAWPALWPVCKVRLMTAKHSAIIAASTSATVGRIRIAGRLEGFAFVPRRELLPAATAALQADLCASLHRRLEVRQQCSTLWLREVVEQLYMYH
jgi:Odorant response abnormal 4-like